MNLISVFHVFSLLFSGIPFPNSYRFKSTFPKSKLCKSNKVWPHFFKNLWIDWNENEEPMKLSAKEYLLHYTKIYKLKRWSKDLRTSATWRMGPHPMFESELAAVISSRLRRMRQSSLSPGARRDPELRAFCESVRIKTSSNQTFNPS